MLNILVTNDRQNLQFEHAAGPLEFGRGSEGKVAAVNAVSDVYAMGGQPLFALNLVC